MKKIILLLCLPLAGWAQFSAGNKFIGGSVGFNNQNNNVQSNVYSLIQNFSVNPNFGFLIKENLAIGVRLGYSKYYQEYQNSNQKSYDQQTLSGGFFARKFFSISEKFLFALDGSVTYGRNTTTYTYLNNNPNEFALKNYNVTAQITPTFIYFPSEHWGIEASIGSLSFMHSYNFISEINSNTFNLSYGSFALGFAYYIRK